MYNPVTYPTETIVKLFREGFFSKKEEDVLFAFFSFKDCKAKPIQIAEILGYSHFVPVNSIVGKLGKRLAKELNLPIRQRDNGTYAGWDVIFEGEDEGREFFWILKKPIEEAIAILDTEIIEINSTIAEEIPSNYKFNEGAKKIVTVNSYERNRVAREICIKIHGTKCKICDFDFEKVYGELGKGYIQVHHIIPISEISREYKVNPETDLIPICPNCHAMIHRNQDRVLEIEELRAIIKAQALLNSENEIS